MVAQESLELVVVVATCRAFSARDVRGDPCAPQTKPRPKSLRSCCPLLHLAMPKVSRCLPKRHATIAAIPRSAPLFLCNENVSRIRFSKILRLKHKERQINPRTRDLYTRSLGDTESAENGTIAVRGNLPEHNAIPAIKAEQKTEVRRHELLPERLG